MAMQIVVVQTRSVQECLVFSSPVRVRVVQLSGHFCRWLALPKGQKLASGIILGLEL